MKSCNADEIILCDLGDGCESPGYGKIDYDGNGGWYNITISGLSHAAIGFNINPVGGKAKFDYIYSTHDIEEISIVKALYNPSDKTDKVDALDNKKFEVDKGKIFNIVFGNELGDNDVIAIYLKSGTASEIYICDYGSQCSSPGYGKIDYDGNEGWYNITISGLADSTEMFNIDPENIKIDYVYAYSIINNSYNIENTTYSDSATIDTEDFTVENFGRWDLLSTEESLNEQTINYYYSTDSGENWNLVNDFNLSPINSSEIRLRAELISDETNTPILNSMTLRYTTNVACEENWILDYTNCYSNNTKLKYYTDENECGTTTSLPEDNDTFVECDYCTPIWSCLSYGDCQQDSKQYCNEVNDSNNCFNITGLTADNYTGNYSEFIASCTYSAPSNSNNQNSGGGRGSRSFVKRESTQETLKIGNGVETGKKDNELIVKQQKSAEKEKTQPYCIYSLDINFPDKILISKNGAIKGSIMNSGNCDIEDVSLTLDEELAGSTSIEGKDIGDMGVGETKEVLIKIKEKTIKEEGIVGFAILPFERKIKSYSGELISAGSNNGTIVIQSRLFINFDVAPPDLSYFYGQFLALGLVVSVLIILIVRKRNKKSKHQP